MYFNGQIIHNRDTGLPHRVGNRKDGASFAWCNLPKRNTHYIYKDEAIWIGVCESLQKARRLLKSGEISSAPIPEDHCRDCGGWIDRRPADWCEDVEHNKSKQCA